MLPITVDSKDHCNKFMEKLTFEIQKYFPFFIYETAQINTDANLPSSQGNLTVYQIAKEFYLQNRILATRAVVFFCLFVFPDWMSEWEILISLDILFTDKWKWALLLQLCSVNKYSPIPNGCMFFHNFHNGCLFR